MPGRPDPESGRLHTKGGLMTQMRCFTPAELEVLGRKRNFLRDQSESPCPACGKVAIRTYLRNTKHAGRPAVISYTWCAACRRMAGSTGALPRGLLIADPWQTLDPAAWQEFDTSLPRLFGRLDRLWDSGVLPQSLSWTQR